MATSKPKRPARKLSPTLEVKTETAPTPDQRKRAFGSDPMWDARRLRIDSSLLVCLALVVGAMLMGPAIAEVIAPPAFIFAGSVMAAYLGVAEWGRINGVLGTSTTTATSVTTQPPPPKKAE